MGRLVLADLLGRVARCMGRDSDNLNMQRLGNNTPVHQVPRPASPRL